ncbi:hypothetical protein BKP45_10310 [Anaerobacillus alkalidiazotrophicus]|uniref:DUF4132 domain-containing protein n=1 Tax=Anaerobacillus alkalidiazotrophicus TaxID=472963 RepID=A0A1S2M915_9BACI|nr:DUF4132 domain-containing protein [Anaerobacillus alkalidiazotrophicus]OIJ20165.1 hypothetical protein BKP45_10310 [Anaerobacillus alkalidiazotrophicus]
MKVGKKEITISSNAFDDVSITYSSDLIANKLLYLTAYDLDEEWIAQLFMFKDVVSTEIRGMLLEYFCHDFSNIEQRKFIFESLADKSIANREFALNKLMKVELLPTEVQKIESVLKLKTSSIRRSAIQILLKQSDEVLDETVERLLTSKSEPQRLAVLEMITELKGDLNRTKQYERYKEKLTFISKPTEKEKLQLAKLTETKMYSFKNGLGLFEPKDHFHILTEIEPLYDYTVKKIFTASSEKIKQFLIGLSDIIHQHRHYQYQAEYYDGYKETLILGSQLQPLYVDGKNKGLDNYPLPQVWRDYINESNIEVSDLLELNYYFELEHLFYNFNLLKHYHSSNDQRKIYLNELFPVEHIEKMVRWLKELTYYSQISQLASAFLVEYDRTKIFPVVNKVLNTMIHQIPVDEIKGQKRFLEFLTAPWLDWSATMAHDDQSFKDYFLLKYNLYVTHNFKRYHLSLEEVARAFQMNLIDEHEVYKELLIREESKHHLYRATSKHDDIVSKYPTIVPFREKILLRILEIELKRGDLPTEVTNLAMQIQYFEGIDYFMKILLALDKEVFVRGYIYCYGDGIAKKEVLSHLLKVCYPKAGDDEVVLKELLENKKLTEKRLLESAMYAPQWIEIVSKLLGWKGLRRAAWYFHAHINETFSAEKETIVAHYSPISPEDFNDGAFDIEWFKQSYNELGEERFAILYDCAKYISAGANHRRSQLFADAILGKLDLETIKNSIVEKRNKNHLLCYSLIPVDHTNKKDVLFRYEFLRESKTFGAQRRATEAKVVMIALANLARNAGYKDVIRLTWDMEAQKMNDVLQYLQLKQLDEELSVQLTIEEQGKADIKILKNGKALKSIPAKYKKHDYIVTLKEVKTELRNQYIRAKEELERSMEMGNVFTLKELETITQNPVVAPIISALIFKVGEHLGFFVDGALVSSSEERFEINKNDVIVIAHPLDLYHSGQWSNYQRKLFDLKLKQPFKQVFRELYLPNEDELALGTISHRYAGHQIQPRKTVALLKNRLWTVSYEEGLQKVYYKENIIAKIFAMADWLSPADVEAPTIEAVQFFDRQTYKSVDITNVPKLIFSEIMRDIDLVVSIAHVGGVDPEASLTTVEMRKAIVREAVRLMKFENVKLEGKFAQISGDLGEYSVHLGSGMVYKQAFGALYIIPVHSQHRGKIFLPFIDDDPKTAEILSKIVMFAEDKKIKDPSILKQIK